MQFHFHIPAFPVNQWVESFIWYADFSPEFGIERLLPDGATHLLIELQDKDYYIFENESLAKQQRCLRAWVSGMHNRLITISSLPNASMLVVRFRPGGSFPIFQIPVDALANTVVDAEQIFGAEIHDLRERMQEAHGPHAIIEAAGKWLMRRAANLSDPAIAVSQKIAELIHQNPTLGKLSEIEESSGYSQKQFIHLFKKHVGMSPKQYQRVARFNHVLQEIEQQQSVNWTTLSLDTGFYDQSHFNHEFKQFSGLNPSQYLMERGEYLNYIPVREVNFLQDNRP